MKHLLTRVLLSAGFLTTLLPEGMAQQQSAANEKAESTAVTFPVTRSSDGIISEQVKAVNPNGYARLLANGFVASSAVKPLQGSAASQARTSAPLRVAGIGANFGNQAYNQAFSSGDVAGSITRISETTFNAMTPAQLRANYDVLLFTWASDPSLNGDWATRIHPYLGLGGKVVWEDNSNIGDLAPEVIGSGYGGFPFAVTSVPGLTDAPGIPINGTFDNNHYKMTSWSAALHPFIATSGVTIGLYGTYPGGGAFILTGPDQDFHAHRGDNAYNLILNILRYVGTPACSGPVVATRPVTLSLNASGDAALTTAAVDDGSTAPCGLQTLSLSKTAFDCSNVGKNTVTLTATDARGNVASAPAVVTVQDNIAPTLAPLTNLVVGAPAALCGAVVSFTPTATDNCAGATVVTNPASGSTFPVGTTPVNVTATDASGNVSTGAFTVTVNDVTAPTVKTQNVSVALANGTAAVTADQVNNGSADACGIASTSLSRTAFGCADLAGGPVPVTLTVTDVHGNASSGQAFVTVTGSLPVPSIAVTPSSSVYTGGVPTALYLGYGPPSATLTASGGVSYTWSPATGLSDAASAAPVFSVATAGTFPYTVTATSASGCTATASVTLTVVDARCGNKNDKVLVCHNGHEICISPNAVDTHLSGHPGDQLGACPLARLAGPGAASGSANELAVYPNPTADQATVSFRPPLDGKAQAVVYNALGQRVASLYEGAVTGGQRYSLLLDSQYLSPGLYECRLVVNGTAEMQRLIIAR